MFGMVGVGSKVLLGEWIITNVGRGRKEGNTNGRSCQISFLAFLFYREISVLIEPREDGPVDMLITYVVGRCLWKPAYDIRLFNSDGSMKVMPTSQIYNLEILPLLPG